MSKIVNIGFKKSLSDSCMLRFLLPGDLMGVLAIHVHDIVFWGSSIVSKIVVEALNNFMPKKHLGDLSW